MDTFQTLTKIIANKLDIDPASIQADNTLEQLGLDSLDTIDIIFSAEEEFRIKVPNDQVAMTTLQDVVNLIDRLIQEQHPQQT